MLPSCEATTPVIWVIVLAQHGKEVIKSIFVRVFCDYFKKESGAFCDNLKKESVESWMNIK